MGLTFQRVLSVPDVPVRDQVRWKTVPARIATGDGRVIFEMSAVEVPEDWSETATNVLAQKYLRKRGVPIDPRPRSEDNVLPWLYPGNPDAPDREGGETSAHQVFHRLAGCWTYWGWKSGVYQTEEDARVFYDETYLCLARQIAAPNSPQFFNTGLHWAYGIEGPASGQWVANPPGEIQRAISDGATAVAVAANLPRRLLGISERDEPSVRQIGTSYVRPQVHACFIQPVADDLVNEGGIMDLWVKEARIFKHGSGSGTNFSALRGEGEPLSGGGRSSGMMSFLRIGDTAAGSIKSGGTSRRAAKMVVVNADHPDVEAFIDWKVGEETKVAAMVVGGQILREAAQGEKGDETVREYVPGAILDRFAHGFEPPDYDLQMEGEAYGTVSGQNANDSVRIPNRFMEAVASGATWELTARTTGEVTRRLAARDLWDRLNRAAWACADPGVQFDDTINEWHTCPVGGRINASNPCSEYYFVDDSGCNLSSLNLVKFLPDDPGSALDVPLLEHVTRLWTTVLEISVAMASFPSAEIARNTYAYRTLGLGYANLGGFLTRSGLPYDSGEGRALAAGITALLTGVAYRTSAELATALGPFPRWEENAENMRRVLRNHARSVFAHDGNYEGLSIVPQRAIEHNEDVTLAMAVDRVWTEVLAADAFRNAQVTVIAPTGTIALLMDCDTTGVEPDFALVKRKSFAGGGDVVLVNRGVEAALARLGYTEGERRAILRDLERNGGSVHACPYVKEAHRAVFDCAAPSPGSDRCVSPLGHLRMVAAIQPLVSGGISKTINLPTTATIEDVADVHRRAWELGVKSVALYRDGCKLDQPLRSGVGAPSVPEEPRRRPPVSVERPPAVTTGSNVEPLRRAPDGVPGTLARGVRERPPRRRTGGITQEVQIGDHQLFLTMNPYPDGRLAEIFLVLAKEGSTLRAFGELFALTLSMGIQHGLPIETAVRMLRNLRFEPAGPVEGHDRVKMVASIADYVARELGLTFLDDDAHGQVVPAIAIDTGERIVALDRRALGVATTGYTGDACPECGNATLRPSGACLSCDTCGATTGCG